MFSLRSWILTAAAAVACGLWAAGERVAAQSSASKPAAAERRERLLQVDRERWPAELVGQELEGPLRAWMSWFADPKRTEAGLRELLDPGFSGTPPQLSGDVHWEPCGFAIEAGRTDLSPVETDAFVESIQAYVKGFGGIDRTEHHVSRIGLETPDGATEAVGKAESAAAEIEVDIRLSALGGESRREDQWTAVLNYARRGEGTGPGWLLRDCRIQAFTSLRGQAQFGAVETPAGPGRPDPGENLYVAYFAEGLALGDIDGDGDLDVFQPRKGEAAALWENDGAGNFTETAVARGLGGLEGVRAGYFFDQENDGDVDLLVLTERRLFLFENDGGRFTDVSERSGFEKMSTGGLTGAAFGDYDRDGLLDFYVVNYGNPDEGPGFGYFDSRNGYFNKLFENRGGGVFADATDAAGLGADNRRWSYAAMFADVDENGWPDLYVVNDYGPNQLFRNGGDGMFRDEAAERGAADFGNGMGVSWGDLDGDGRMDLYVSNMESYAGKRITRAAGFPGDAEIKARAFRFAKGNTWLRGVGDGRFEEVEGSLIELGRWAWGNLLWDYDNDGDLDVYVANGMFTNAGAADT
ncbi:MAG TPA: VCBS repeat-containing protein [Verrucomicrobiales bacterium]|nr:VCBS repeat-containing protein [Verrucomicrobiales bacterium]